MFLAAKPITRQAAKMKSYSLDASPVVQAVIVSKKGIAQLVSDGEVVQLPSGQVVTVYPDGTQIEVKDDQTIFRESDSGFVVQQGEVSDRYAAAKEQAKEEVMKDRQRKQSITEIAEKIVVSGGADLAGNTLL